MRTIRAIFHLVILTLAVLYAVSCSTVETTVTAPDGTITVTKATAPDAASVAAIAETAQAYAPRPIPQK